MLPEARAGFDPLEVPAGTVARVRKLVGFAPDGAPVAYPLIVVAGAEPGPTAALVAGIHGDEYEGPRALWSVLEALDPARLRGRVVVVPVAHQAAFVAATRPSPVDGVNLARIFPGDPEGTITQRLAHDLFETVVRRADFLVDLHSGGVRLAFLPVAGWYEGPLAERSRALATDLGLDHLWRLPPRDGVLSYEAVKAGVAATGAEAGGRGGCLDGDWRAYRDGVLRILARRGMTEAAPEAPRTYETYLDGDFALAPTSGFIEVMAPLGANVTAGQPLARIRSTFGDTMVEMNAAADGLVMAIRHLRTIHAGEWATCAVLVRRFGA
jgi:predicted deacylase